MTDHLPSWNSLRATFSSGPVDYRDVLAHRFQGAAKQAFESGEFRPFVWPWDSLGPNLLILYLLIPPTESRLVHWLRWPVFAVVLVKAVDCILYARSEWVSVGYGIGLLNAWAVLWSATLILFNDARKDFRRVEGVVRSEVGGSGECAFLGRLARKEGLNDSSACGDDVGRQDTDSIDVDSQLQSNDIMNGSTGSFGGKSGHSGESASVAHGDGNDQKPLDDGIRKRHGLKDESSVENQDKELLKRKVASHQSEMNKEIDDHSQQPQQKSNLQIGAFRWQHLPADFFHRLDWVLDLISSFRGPRWSHQISGMTPPPQDIQSQLQNSPFGPPTSFSTISRRQLLRKRIPEFIGLVLLLDILKSICMEDPYFLSLGPNTPSPFPRPRLSRILLSVSFVYASLQTIFLLAPLVMVGLLSPKAIDQHAQPWLYSPYFGSVRAFSKKGLAGAWGQWWQQLFRFGFEQAGEAAARLIGQGWEKKTKKGQALRVFMAFACSGALHACASYTSLGPTKPLNSMLFFLLQILGVMGQRAMSIWLKTLGMTQKLPWWSREAGNAVFVATWFYITGPLVADDFAAVGIWLYEPVPVSLVRGLRGKGWWFWGGSWIRFHRADKWWQSGLAF
ncbi:uncharacterized protein KY384_003867 [Bacidia gigantensis]|uniref:uncharacterized protein n=1 Tax=Bacidia gigantensis TaxID=2732470 RepID=UPI001D05766B|nr:uncharacterized protein KY384_003867 [Bacidia gigantensis]KAG8532226.1 hypothetical protein KY384_003867 [Bacidia gigantensis]